MSEDTWVLRAKQLHVSHYKLIFLLYLFGLSLIALSLWTERYFGRVTVNQLLSTINFDLHGTLSADHLFIKRLLTWCVAWPLIITCAIMVFAARYINTKLNYFISVGLISIGLMLVARQYSVLDYVHSLQQTDKDYFAEHYVDSAKLTFTLKKPKSLVLIYIEGMESGYSNPELFNHDLLQSLNRIKASQLSFKSYEQMPGANWTIAGIVASQCGVPLKVMTIFNGNRAGEYMNHYLPGATCMSDILATFGYQNIFMKGASLSFSGMNTFLNDHAYKETYGREEWLARGIPESEMNGWGLPDDLLFAQAKSRLNDLMKHNQLFNLTILTVDTHGYEGFSDRTCRANNKNSFEEVVECTASETANFVNYIREQGWLDKINVVVMGDHLAMENAAYDKLKQNQHRTIFNLILTKNKITKNRDEIFHVDMMPTLLKLAGVQFKGEQLGLGVAAIGHANLPRYTRHLSDLDEQVNHDSPVYNALWEGARRQ